MRKTLQTDAGSSRPFLVGMALTAMVGGAAMAHELLWMRRLVDVLGASAASSTRVLGCFFVGMALGAAAASLWARRLARPWRAVAWCEAGVALLAVPAACLPRWSDWIWPALGGEALMGWEGPAVKLVISSLMILPPACCMGLVFPLMVSGVLRGQPQASRHGVWLYGVHALGGVLGLTGLCLITLQVLGASGSMWLAIGLNLTVASAAAVLDRASPVGPECARSVPDAGTSYRRTLWAAVGMAFFSGMGFLCFEVLALHLVGLAAPLSFYAPMVVLAAVVLLLGTAALVVPPLVRRKGGRASAVTRMALLGASVGIVGAPLWFFQLVQWVPLEPQATVTAFLARLLSVALVAFGPAILLAGLVFPSVLAWLGGEGGDRGGRLWGWLLAANGLGGWLGAEMAYRVVMPLVGVHRGMGCVGVAYGVICLGSVLMRRPRGLAPIGLAVAVTAGAAALTAGPLSWLPELNTQGILVLDQWRGREGTVAVVDSPVAGLRIIMSNQYVLGGTAFRYDQARLAHLPLVMHAQPRRVACIGLATGITAGAVLEHRCVESLTAVELSPLVVRAADTHFGPFNHHVTRDPRARVVVEDARTFLAAAPASFDVVIGDLLLPWAPGEARLYSLEHFRSVQDSLKPGGVFCQWVAMYQLTPEHFELIRATFCQVFPRVLLFKNTFDCRQPALALVGFRDSDFDWSTVAGRCNEIRRSNEVRDPLVRHDDGLAMLFLGGTENGSGTAVNTLSNMRLELAAGRDRITSRAESKYLQGEAWLRFSADRLASMRAGPGYGAEHIRLARLGHSLSFWEAVRNHVGPLSREDLLHLPAVREEIQRSFPESIRADDQADWSQWPGDVAVTRAVPDGGDFRPDAP